MEANTFHVKNYCTLQKGIVTVHSYGMHYHRSGTRRLDMMWPWKNVINIDCDGHTLKFEMKNYIPGWEIQNSFGSKDLYNIFLCVSIHSSRFHKVSGDFNEQESVGCTNATIHPPLFFSSPLISVPGRPCISKYA